MELIALVGGDRQLLITGSAVPQLRWFGAALPDHVVAGHETLFALTDRPIPNASISQMAPATLLPCEADGWVGPPGIEGSRADGSAWSPSFTTSNVELTSNSAVISALDERALLQIVTRVTLTPSGVATVAIELENVGSTDYSLTALRLTVPLPDDFTEVQVPEGRWVHEYQEVRLPLRAGAIEQTNRRGRTSSDKPPWIMAGTTAFSSETGTVFGAHLGWSGNASVRAEVLADGRRFLQLGEQLLAGEVVLEPGGVYTSPTLHLGSSSNGMNGVSQSFHRYIRSRPQHERLSSPRPIHLNTWEAVYFDHDLDKLSELADHGAAVGAERYVLDDGWFHSRRSDSAGLGDWWVDPEVWPDGLEPLIEHVTGLGLEFGIWVEPEMVNPDSDLFREHPDWVLGAAGYEPVLGRNQLVLDLTNSEAFDYVLGHLDALLTNHDVSYVKWDMNRDHVQPASSVRAASHHQTLAVYSLIDALRERHPDVEIESCSSGGARADLGILERTDRVWASDSNDALARQRIQRGFLRWFPPELMGAHVGPQVSHTSGRNLTLGFRGATALFGHMGIEWNLSAANDKEREQLKEILDLHKAHRELLHTGTVWQLDTVDASLLASGVMSNDGSIGLYSVAQLEISRYGTPESLRLAGLDPDANYSLSLLLLADTKLGLAVSQPRWVSEPVQNVSGAVLTQVGVALPCLDPESAILLRVERL